MHRKGVALLFLVLGFLSVLLLRAGTVSSEFSSIAKDPGVRGGIPGAGTAFYDLTQSQLAFHNAGLTEFQEEEGVDEGL